MTHSCDFLNRILKENMKNNYLVLIGLVLISACSTMTHRGVIAMKINNDEAHVGMGSSDLSLGDHVELYHNECKGSARTNDPSCEKVSNGHGEVTRIINENYSVVKFPSGTKFSEGDTVEKHAH
jgi:hypothetical protein